MNGTQLVGVEMIATIYGEKMRGLVRWYRESHGTYGFQPDGASPTEELIVVGRDQLEFAHN